MSLFFFGPLFLIALLHIPQLHEFTPSMISDLDDIITLVCCGILLVHTLMSGMLMGGY